MDPQPEIIFFLRFTEPKFVYSAISQKKQTQIIVSVSSNETILKWIATSVLLRSRQSSIVKCSNWNERNAIDSNKAHADDRGMLSPSTILVFKLKHQLH